MGWVCAWLTLPAGYCPMALPVALVLGQPVELGQRDRVLDEPRVSVLFDPLVVSPRFVRCFLRAQSRPRKQWASVRLSSSTAMARSAGLADLTAQELDDRMGPRRRVELARRIVQERFRGRIRRHPAVQPDCPGSRHKPPGRPFHPSTSMTCRNPRTASPRRVSICTTERSKCAEAYLGSSRIASS